MQTDSNIEDFFKTELFNFEAFPSSNTWSNVEKGLNDRAMETLFQEKLSSQLVTPNKAIWKAIAASLSTIGFWNFSLRSLNIYTSAIAASIIAIGIYIYPFQKNNTNSDKSNNISVNTIKNNSTIDNNKDNSNSYSKPNKPTESNKVLFTGNNNDTDDSVTDKIQSNNTYSTSNTTPIKLSVITNDKDKKTKNNKSKENTDTKQNNIPKNQALNTNNYYSDYILNKNPNKAFVDTLIVYDTIKYFDTLIYKSPLQKLKTSKIWSISPHLSLFGSNPIYSSNKEQANDLASINNQAVSNNISYAFGLGVNYDLKKWRFSTGIDYSVIQEEFNYQTQETKTNPVTKYNLIENGFYTIINENTSYLQEPKYEIQHDTISIHYTVEKIELEHYTVIDTTWKYEINTHLVKVSDSTAVIKYDTVRVANYDTSYYNIIDTSKYLTYYQNINKYSYLEIPLSVGYAINISKLTLRPTVGALVGIMLNAKGNGISMEDHNRVYNMSDLDLPFLNIQVSLLMGLGIEYQLQNNFSLFIQPYYRRNISSIYKPDCYLDKRFSGIGVSFGLSYYFL